jgi:NADH-quinone oxidoreductase subunit E
MTVALSERVKAHMDAWLTRYPADQKRSGVFEALRVVQEENGGFLTEALMNAVADYLDIPHIAVYEVATFYSMYRLSPAGRHVVEVCTNISCMLVGAEKIVAHLKEKWGIEVGETTPDGQYTLKAVECLGACVHAPVCMIGKKYHEKLTPERMDEVLEGLQG